MKQALAGRRIVVTRSREQSDELVELLMTHGAEALICPAIAFAPPIDPEPFNMSLQRLATYDWLLFTSANAVRFTFETFAALHGSLQGFHQLQIGVIGPATARMLSQYGCTVTLMPCTHTAVDLLAEIGEVRDKRILIPAADLARDTLAAGLRARGALVEVVIAYRTIPGEGGQLLAQSIHCVTIDATTFTSPSTVQYLLDGLQEAGVPRTVACKYLGAIVCIGPTTSAAARSEGLQVAAEPTTATVAGLLEALQVALA